MKLNRQRLIFIGTCLAIILFYATPIGDADLGWHLAYGEYFLKTGHILTQNTFSWQMPDYIWANHSWGFDIIAAWLFHGSYFWTLSLAAGVCVAIACFLLINPATLEGQLAIMLFSLFGQFLLNIGFRSQYLSLIGTAVLWKLLTKLHAESHTEITYKKWHLAFPVLFLVWANMHGQFIYGLGIMGLSLIPYLFSKHSPTIRYTIGLLISSSLITLINPFTYHLWTTAASHLNAPELQYINEWASWPVSSPLFGGLILFSLVLWTSLLKQKQPLHVLIPLGSLTILAITSRRIIPYYLLVCLPYLAEYLQQWTRQLPQKNSIHLILTLILVGYSIYYFNTAHIFSQNWDRYCHTNVYCSEKATAFMRNHHIQGKLWNAYRLGGYLIYRLPSIKPMIDGRMTMWHQPDGTSPFLQYTQMVYVQPNARNLFDAINPDYVLIQPQYPLAQALLKENTWPVIYTDEQVLLFQNPQATTSAKLSH